MDRFFGAKSPEFTAFTYLTEQGSTWDTDGPINESLLGHCVAYQAVARYLTGEDIFIHPRSRSELESIFRRHSYDSIHNAKSVSSLAPGGYGRVCYFAEQSIRRLLDTDDNAATLLSLHSPPSTPTVAAHDERAPRSIRTV